MRQQFPGLPFTTTLRARIEYFRQRSSRAAADNEALRTVGVTMHEIARSVMLLAAIFLWPALSFAQVQVIISGGFLAVYSEVLPEFVRTTGINVNTARGSSQGSGPNTVGGQLRRNVPADVIILNTEGLAELMAEGRILAGSDISLAKSELAVGVRAGTSKPDIATIEAFKQTLLHAKSVVTDSSTSGMYLANTVFPGLGIAEVMAKKTSAGGADAVARGDAEIVIRLVSELVPVSGSSWEAQPFNGSE